MVEGTIGVAGPTLAAAVAGYARTEFLADDPGCNPDAKAAHVVCLVCAALVLYEGSLDDPERAQHPLISLLGGADYVRACLAWERACGEWDRLLRQDQGPYPVPPAVV